MDPVSGRYNGTPLRRANGTVEITRSPYLRFGTSGFQRNSEFSALLQVELLRHRGSSLTHLTSIALGQESGKRGDKYETKE